MGRVGAILRRFLNPSPQNDLPSDAARIHFKLDVLDGGTRMVPNKRIVDSAFGSRMMSLISPVGYVRRDLEMRRKLLDGPPITNDFGSRYHKPHTT